MHVYGVRVCASDSIVCVCVCVCVWLNLIRTLCVREREREKEREQERERKRRERERDRERKVEPNSGARTKEARDEVFGHYAKGSPWTFTHYRARCTS